ncbi:ABC transporter permease [Chiayiivirga flava]|uniref:Putative permease n=1 Tax=Chiayiivirga flava TaxID=659595 RepID=A0A7W8D319_9GAMM|nr:ABC transporter permease [Chiayiivirga flava]MBB5206939.1 putative permease [Chiayiivirga flava]
MLDAIVRDLRLATRNLFAKPGFFIVAVLTLALGIGSVSAIYSVVNGTLLSPLPYPQAERIVRITREQPPYGGPISRPLLFDWQKGTADVYSAVAGFTGGVLTLTGSGDAERLSAIRVSPEFWTVMDLAPEVGRYFGVDEERANTRVAVLTHALWTQRFGADPAIVGRDIVLDGESYRVTGVTPARFRFPGSAQLFVPTYLPASQLGRDYNSIHVVARLRDGVDAETATAALHTLNLALQKQYPESNTNLTANTVPLPELLTGNVRQPLMVLSGAAALVLLIACANLANLLLIRGNQRQRELAVRSALGAGRRRLVRSVLAEALVIALVGGVLGVALAAVAVPLLLAGAPDLMPSHATPGVDFTVVGLGMGVSACTVLLFSLWPAWRSAAVAPAGALQEEGRSGSGGRARSRTRSVLVVAEVALSLTLLVGAGLMIASLSRLGQVDDGIDLDPVLTAAIALPAGAQRPDEDFEAAYKRNTIAVGARLDALLERVSALPGVEVAGLTDALPLSGMDNASSNVVLIGRDPVPEGQPQRGVQWRFTSPGYFPALGIRLVAGRLLEEADRNPGGYPTQVLVNETFVKKYLPDVDPVGRQIQFLGDNKTIVGVVGDVRQMGLDSEPLPEAFMHTANSIHSQFYLVLKVRGDPGALAEPLRRTLKEFDAAMPVFEVRTLAALGAQRNAMRLFNLQLMTIFGGVALLLAAVGLYGTIAYSVAQRRHEFGIRLSLGASGAQLMSQVMKQGMGLVAIGVLAGIAGALALGRVLASQLFGVGAGDPGVLFAAVALLGGIALVACLVPALRASRVHPMTVLRSQ